MKFKPAFLNLICFVSLFFLIQNSGNKLFCQQHILSNWTVEDGLSSNYVTDILQDKDGLMWISTEHGLNKFDGYSFNNFRYDPKDSTTIGANFISHICQDEQDNIWSLLTVGIISKYNKSTRQFTNFTLPNGEGFIFELNYVANIGLLVASSVGLFIIDNDILRKIDLDNETERPDAVYGTFQKSADQLYLSTNKGFELYTYSKRIIEETFNVCGGDKKSFAVYVKKYFRDANGVGWVQTHSGSIYQSKDGRLFSETLPQKGPNAAPILGELFISENQQNSLKSFFHGDGVRTFNAQTNSWLLETEQLLSSAFAFTDNNKDLWICTKNNELYKWNIDQWELKLEMGERLNYWEINRVFVDNENGIWFSSRGKGIWRIYNRKWPISSFSSGTDREIIDFEINALLQEDNDFIWLGTFGNLYKYYFATKKLTAIFPNEKAKNPLSGLMIKDLEFDKTGNIWIATNRGVVVTDKKGMRYQHLQSVQVDQKTVEIKFVRCLLADSANRIWIGTTHGMLMKDLTSDTFNYYHTSAPAGLLLSGPNIQCLTQINENQFLIGYIKYGVDLMSFNPEDRTIRTETLKYEFSRPENFNLMTANTFYQADGDIWLGTFSRGLLKIDIAERNIHELNNDFPIIPNVKGIQKGINGNLWVSSIDGIRSVDPDDNSFYRFTKSSGLCSNHFSLNSNLQDGNGNLYFGSYGGLNKIQPADWTIQDTVSTPLLTNFETLDKNISIEQPLDEIESIVLNHKDDFIKFEFVSPTFHNPEDVEYAYQLENFDANWRNGDNQRSATYTNLPPGNYTFKIKAGNKGGFLNSKTKSINLTISPPFWQTSWFIILCFSAILFVIWLTYKIQSHLRENRLKLAMEVRKKAADDFHDDLGHRLTKISLFVESLMLQKDKFPTQSVHILRKIQDNANELYASTKDFIWAMNPTKDSVLELLILLKDFGEELYADTPIHFVVEGFAETLKGHMLGMDEKRQLTMIFKEAMNNTLKHANCTEVFLKVEQNENQTKIGLSDNGRGFVLNHEKFGYGLGSMMNRSKKVGGHLEIKSRPGKGTEVLLEIN